METLIRFFFGKHVLGLHQGRNGYLTKGEMSVQDVERLGRRNVKEKTLKTRHFEEGKKGTPSHRTSRVSKGRGSIKNDQKAAEREKG